MAGNKVEAATLVNRVTYQTDRASLKKVRKEIRDLQNLMNRLRGGAGNGRGGRGGSGGGGGAGGSAGSGAAAEARRKIKEARDEVRRIAKARVQAEKEAAQRAKKAQEEINRRLSGGRLGAGGRHGGSSGGSSAADSARAFEEEFKRQERARMEAQNRAMLAQQRQIDAQRERILKARAEQEKRDRVANRVSNQFAFDTSRLNLSTRQMQNASRSMEDLNRRYRSGALDIADYRQQSRQLLRTLRDEAGAAKTLGERLRDLRRGGSGGLGAGGKILGLGLLGGIGAAYMGASAARNALGSGVEQSRGLSRVGTMGIGTEETQALQLAALRATGFNLSYEKISDISKDVQDKVGQLSLGKWNQNKKTGEWSFGGGGELGDWVKIMTERGGYGRDEAINTLQSAKGPVEMAIILQNLRKSAKLTDSEFTALSEAINDFSYITKSVGDNAENVDKAMFDLAQTGRLYTDQEKENLKQLSNMAAEYKATTDVLEGKFASSFVDGLKQAGLDSNNLGKALSEATPLVKSLGEQAGHVAAIFVKILGWLGRWSDQTNGPGAVKSIQEGNTGGLANENALFALAQVYWDKYFGDKGTESFNPGMMRSGNFDIFNSNNPLGTQQMIQNHLSMTIQIDPNAGELSRAFNAHALDVFNNGMDDLTFDVNNMTFNN